MPAKIAPAPIVTNNIGKAQQIHVLALAKRLIQPSLAPVRGLSHTDSASDESSTTVPIFRVDLTTRIVNLVVTIESRRNF